MKKTIRIDPPARDYGRLPRVGKHSTGKPPRVIMGQAEGIGIAGHTQRIEAKAKAKPQFLASSNAEADRIQREKQHARELARWFAEDLTLEQQEFARAHGLHEHLPTGITFGAVGKGNEQRDEEFADAAESTQASTHDHPIDHLEPTGAVEIDELTNDEIAGAGEAFDAALRWALDGTDLVAMGRRAAVLIFAFRPCLADGLVIDDALRDQFFKRVSGDHRAAGILFGRALERIRSACSLSGFGQQLYVVAYVLRPAFINADTLSAIGDLNAKTRQAISKHVNALRDAFAGLRCRAMRPDVTRTRCQSSQLARS